MVVGSSAVLLTAGIAGVWLFSRPASTAPSSDATTATKTTGDASRLPTKPDDTGSTTTVKPAVSNTANESAYQDGTYSNTVSYYVPKGSNDLTAKVTVTGGTVTAVSVDHKYSDHQSGMYIDSFDSTLQDAVVGKSIEGLSLGRIGGATLTTQAFDDAITAIRDDAKD